MAEARQAKEYQEHLIGSMTEVDFNVKVSGDRILNEQDLIAGDPEEPLASAARHSFDSLISSRGLAIFALRLKELIRGLDEPKRHVLFKRRLRPHHILVAEELSPGNAVAFAKLEHLLDQFLCRLRELVLAQGQSKLS